MNTEQLQREVERLRHKLSPLEDKDFTTMLTRKMAKHDLLQFRRKFRKGDYVVISPSELADLCGIDPNMHTFTNIGRSLQALCWERSALHGQLIFVMPVEEYNATRKP